MTTPTRRTAAPLYHVHLTPNDKGSPAGKLADAELRFTAAAGTLADLRLWGFAVWERRNGSGRNVTFPARAYSVNGERRSYALLRPVEQGAAAAHAQDAVRDDILSAYAEWEHTGALDWPSPEEGDYCPRCRTVYTPKTTNASTYRVDYTGTVDGHSCAACWYRSTQVVAGRHAHMDLAQANAPRPQAEQDASRDRDQDASRDAQTAAIARATGQPQPLPDGGSIDPDGFRWAPDTQPQAAQAEPACTDTRFTADQATHCPVCGKPYQPKTVNAADYRIDQYGPGNLSTHTCAACYHARPADHVLASFKAQAEPAYEPDHRIPTPTTFEF